MLIFNVVQCAYFVFYTMFHLFFKLKSISQHTRKLQQQFFISTVLQVVIPIVVYFIPLFYCIIALYLDYYNQAFNNFTMIAIGSNGLFTVIVMIVVYNPYRVAVKEMFFTRINTKNNSGINNSRNTNLFYSRKI
ncbi:unnamed protein product [Caenorhabditis nigoni]